MSTGTNELAPGLSERRIVRPRTLRHGTMVTTDLVAAQKFYEEFLGLTCTSIAPDRLLLQLSTSRAGDRGWESQGCLIDVRAVPSIERPQNVLNHWGIDVPSRADVDRIHAAAHRHKQRYGLRRIMAVRMQHGVYGFYMQDRDSNWWEIEYTDPERTHQILFTAGDQYQD